MSQSAAAREPQREPLAHRQDLLEVAVACLARLGARGATVREICRQAGVSHGLLRHYFANPDNLLLETYEQLCAKLRSHVEAATAPAEGDPWDTLHRFFVAVFSERWAGPDVIGAWMVFWQLVRSRVDFAAVSAAFNRRQRALLDAVVRRLPAAGAIPRDDTIALLSAVLDGPWIEYHLAEARTPAARCIALCDLAARRLFAD